VGTDSGHLGTWVTYGPGGRVSGVTVHDGDTGRTASVRLVVGWDRHLPGVAADAWAAALAALDTMWPDDGPWRVDVEVTDVALPHDHKASALTVRRAPVPASATGRSPSPELTAATARLALPTGPAPESVPIDLGGAGSVTVPGEVS
jgi:hypothetical protein